MLATPRLCKICKQPCKKKYSRCKACFLKRNRTKRITPTSIEKYEAYVKRKLKPPAKNRKKSKVIEAILAGSPIPSFKAIPTRTILRKNT